MKKNIVLIALLSGLVSSCKYVSYTSTPISTPNFEQKNELQLTGTVGGAFGNGSLNGQLGFALTDKIGLWATTGIASRYNSTLRSSTYDLMQWSGAAVYSFSKSPQNQFDVLAGFSQSKVEKLRERSESLFSSNISNQTITTSYNQVFVQPNYVLRSKNSIATFSLKTSFTTYKTYLYLQQTSFFDPISGAFVNRIEDRFFTPKMQGIIFEPALTLSSTGQYVRLFSQTSFTIPTHFRYTQHPAVNYWNVHIGMNISIRATKY